MNLRNPNLYLKKAENVNLNENGFHKQNVTIDTWSWAFKGKWKVKDEFEPECESWWKKDSHGSGRDENGWV